MIIELNNTTTQDITSALIRAHREVGPTSGMVLTLLAITDDYHQDEVLSAARASATAHPSRVIVVSKAGGETRLHAKIQVGEGLPGDLIALKLHGELASHGDSVVLPLLLPDSPTIAWWPHKAPDAPAQDPIGRLATRRITDSMGAPDPQLALAIRARNLVPGDTDLCWTRITRWRALLAAALDQFPHRVTSARVRSTPDNACSTLLVTWLEQQLGVPVLHEDSDQPGISEARLTTDQGDIVINRGRSETIARYAVPGQPERKVALKRRPLTELLTEELQRMDPDAVFESVVSHIATRVGE